MAQSDIFFFKFYMCFLPFKSIALRNIFSQQTLPVQKKGMGLHEILRTGVQEI